MVNEVSTQGLEIGLATPPPEVLLTPNIGVIGVGGAGGNAVNNMVSAGLGDVAFFVANTDAQALSHSLVANKIQLGAAITKGLGAGANPEVGKAAAEESSDQIKEVLSDLHLLFITAGMGGGTGTGAAPVVAKIAKELGILTVGVVSKPFNLEGPRRMKVAEEGILELQKYVDTLIVIPNQNLFRIDDGTMTFANGFKIADNVLCQGVKSITDLIMNTGLINHDFADVKTVLLTHGRCVLGTAEAEGEDRAKRAAEKAMSNPLLDNPSVKGAKSLLLNISGSLDLKASEVDLAAELIRTQVDPNANIIFGSNMDEKLAGKIRVSLIATGIDDTAMEHVAEEVVVKPQVVEVTPAVNVPTPKIDEPISVELEPELIEKTTADVFEKMGGSVSPDIVEVPDDLVINLKEKPQTTEPFLIDDDVPVMPETLDVTDVPEEKEDIDMNLGKKEENLKKAVPQHWWEIFPQRKKKAKSVTVPEEPSFLDDSDLNGLDLELPRCLTEPRK